MRINPANSSPIQSADTQASKKTEKSKANAYEARSEASGVSSNSDSVNTDISGKARDMARAKQAASESPDVREAKIAELREKIQNKKYNVGADAIADRLVDDHLKLAGA
jgi:negative regulator of flagellin synthesis FlgM